MPGGWRRTGLTTAAAPSRAAWLAAGNGWNAPARQGRPAVARRVFGGDRSMLLCLVKYFEREIWISFPLPGMVVKWGCWVADKTGWATKAGSYEVTPSRSRKEVRGGRR